MGRSKALRLYLQLEGFSLLYIELIGHNFFPVFVEKLFAILTEVQEGLQIVILCQIRESDGRVLKVLVLDQISCSGIGGTVGNVLEILQMKSMNFSAFSLLGAFLGITQPSIHTFVPSSGMT